MNENQARIVATTTSIAAMMSIDAVFHMGEWGLLVTIASGATAWLFSPDAAKGIKHVLSGEALENFSKKVAMTDEIRSFVDLVPDAIPNPQLDQRPLAKLKRLAGVDIIKDKLVENGYISKKGATRLNDIRIVDELPERTDVKTKILPDTDGEIPVVPKLPSLSMIVPPRRYLPENAEILRNNPDSMAISKDLSFHADEFLSERKFVCGISGSGKSNTTAVLIEELGRLNVPLIVFDTENEYSSLCDKQYLPNCVRTTADNLGQDNASEFAAYIMENNLQCIVNLQEYDMEDAAWVMVLLIEGLTEWQDKRRALGQEPVPCEAILEEATTWLPQKTSESALNGKEVFSRLQSAFFNDLVRKGRKRGMGLTIVCQKIAEIDKRALQCGMKFLQGQKESRDLAAYQSMDISKEETLSLQKGEVFFFSSKCAKKRLKIRLRHSPHGASTPGLSELRRYQDTRNQLRAETPLVFEDFDTRKPYATPSESVLRRPVEPTYALVEPLAEESPRNFSNTRVTPSVTDSGRWSDRQCEMFQVAYAASASIDKSLKAIGIPTSPKNRDFAKSMLQPESGSPIEIAFNAAWRELGTDIELQREYEVGRYRIDFAHVETRTAIELDGFANHSSTEDLAKDHRRQRALTALGWKVIRFGGKEINEDACACAREVLEFIVSCQVPI